MLEFATPDLRHAGTIAATTGIRPQSVGQHDLDTSFDDTNLAKIQKQTEKSNNRLGSKRIETEFAKEDRL